MVNVEFDVDYAKKRSYAKCPEKSMAVLTVSPAAGGFIFYKITADVGGVASGTEQYYSFDYGNVHFVSLDSQLSARDKIQRDAMRGWLIADLSSNQLDWTVVIFHHPPYTKGSHDSDEKPSSYFGIDTPIIDMRKEFTPVLRTMVSIWCTAAIVTPMNALTI